MYAQKSTLLNSNSIWAQSMKSHFVEMPLQIPIPILFSIINHTNPYQSHALNQYKIDYDPH